ncbi:SLC13 family permease [Ferrimonas balearica]|uniref:SLC13 family permease n=1 Tax=Ferrimonas balearica TaxID=44012 RepID=UPI001C999009|nr:SLC13 family permease [Ferrimonas balearica]MBY5922090.1 SLC13 family permease [Ferrimonas balearica]MBY5994570.1 SLC13 family permease [Ferrimonas balearica]
MPEHLLVITVVACIIFMFLFSNLRHDVVALIGLMSCVLFGLVPETQVFNGFSHPAVITVAGVLIISAGLQSSGVLNLLANRLLPKQAGPIVSLSILCLIGAFISAFMNNVGAMALLMPLAISVANKSDMAPGKLLMPLSFCTILGGMITLIGTPPNLIVSGFRNDVNQASFQLFDFAPVGGAVALAGVAFVVLVGWRLVPHRAAKLGQDFESGSYLTEVAVGEGSPSIGKSLTQLEKLLEQEGIDGQLVALHRGNLKLSPALPWRQVAQGDTVLLELEPQDLSNALSLLGMTLPSPEADADTDAKTIEPDTEDNGEKLKEITYQEYVVMPNSPLLGRSALDIGLSTRFGLTLMAISRQGQHSIHRLKTTPLKTGDLLLLQGDKGAQNTFASGYRCLPLAQRDLALYDTSKALLAILILAGVLLLSGIGFMTSASAFVLGVVLFLLAGIIPTGQVYNAVDWPVIVLLGAMMPVAEAMSSTGTASWIAQMGLGLFDAEQPELVLALVIVLTMTLSDFMNNAATAALMCPIASSLAAQLGVSTDTFLMAVAVGASCSFLTPIGHQNNTLILGPGGFRFGDYWRLGLPMELLVLAVSLPMLLLVWPLTP